MITSLDCKSSGFGDPISGICFTEHRVWSQHLKYSLVDLCLCEMKTIWDGAPWDQMLEPNDPGELTLAMPNLWVDLCFGAQNSCTNPKLPRNTQ